MIWVVSFKYYETKLKSIKEAFNNKFLKVVYDVQKLAPTDSTVSQTSNTLPLYLNMVPEKKRKTVLKTLIDSIKNEFDYHFNTGIVGTRYLFDVLTDNGYPEIIYRMVNQTSFPGYGYMIAEGATTLWERWEKLEGAGMNSRNHIMLGSVDPWFFKSLAGMNALKPSWKSIMIKPFIPEDMDYVSASLNTIRGPLHVSWEKLSDRFKLVCKIPLGSTVELWFPKNNKGTSLKEGEIVIWEQGKQISNDLIEFLGEEEDYLLFKLGSGYYEFNLEI